MAKIKLTSEEYAELFLKEEIDNPSLEFETFCAKHGILAPKQQGEISTIIEKAKADATRMDLKIFDKPILSPKRFGFDFEGGCAFHGTYIGDNEGNPEPILIKSDRSYIRQAFFQEKNLKFGEMPPASAQFYLYGWRRDAIKQWVTDGKIEDVKMLYPKVRSYFAKHVYHPDPMFHDVVACCVLATHIWICFDAFPRLLILAKPDSGKSQLVKAIRNLCFKPITTGDATKSAMFRLANATAGVFIFDNFDKIPDEQKQEIMHFIEISYQNDLPVFRVEDAAKKGGRVPTGFDVGVPLVAATTDLASFSHAALTRSITLVMERCERNIEALPDAKPSEDSNQLRQELYAWGLSQAPTMKVALGEYCCDFTARQAQIARPLLFIASIVDEKLHEKMTAWLASNFESYHAEEEFSERVQVVRALYECVKGRREMEITVPVKDVSELLLVEQGIEKTDSQGRPNSRYTSILKGKGQTVSSNIASIPLSKKKMMRGITHYRFQRDALFRYFARFGLLSEDEAQTSLPSSQSSHSMLSSPSSLSTPSTTLQHECVERIDGIEGKGRVRSTKSGSIEPVKGD